MKYHLTAMKSGLTATKLNRDEKSSRDAKKAAAAKLLCNSDAKGVCSDENLAAAMKNQSMRNAEERRNTAYSDET